MSNKIYNPEYSNNWALIIGINKYKVSSSLDYATNDAEAISDLLISKFNFPKENVSVLLDENANRNSIFSKYLEYCSKTSENDKILFFYAGHGYTCSGNRGEVGFLVPHDGDPKDISSLIRWDDLTKNSELIPAKHMLFIMDACYGGLAITRSLSIGSTRFLKDMLQRYSRQVITAGKANETVSDSGGPIPNHSVFTGHLIQALNGNASTSDGIITANSVMSYVYEKVANDIHSKQTPHYGFFDGDGDFVFYIPEIKSLLEDKETDKDILVSIPPVYSEKNEISINHVVSTTKEYLSDNKYFIKLNDFINQLIRETQDLFITKQFNNNEQITYENFYNRITIYNDIVIKLQSVICCIFYWGNLRHFNIIRSAFARLTDHFKLEGGYEVWLGLKWYPIISLLYSTGIAAIASKNYSMLLNTFNIEVPSTRSSKKNKLIISIVEEISEFSEKFKLIPGHERNSVPRSEYLFKTLQPLLDDLLFLGKDYEDYFDYFEIIFTLVCADYNEKLSGSIWAPLGRFALKHKRAFHNESIFSKIYNEASILKENWDILKIGFFDGSFERFDLIYHNIESHITHIAWT